LTVIIGVVAPAADSLAAVIVAAPTPIAVTVVTPFVELAGITVNTDGLLDTQFTVRPNRVPPAASFVVAVSTCVSPTIIGVVRGETVTSATGAGVTVIEDVPVFVSLVAVIVVVPAPTAVTRPFPSTVAAASLLEIHVTRRPLSTLSAASRKPAVSCWVGATPTTRLAVAGVTVTVATGTALTVITAVGAELTDSLFAVIVAVPAPSAVTVVVPLVELAGLTANTAVLLDTQLTVRPVRVLFAPSLRVAVSCRASPTTIGVGSVESVTAATGASVTMTEDVPVLVSLVAVIVEAPAPTAVTRPLSSTVAAAVLLELQATVRPVSA
jgi:hypothetical protein